MGKEEKNENNSKKYSVGSWIGLAMGIGIGAVYDNILFGAILGVVLVAVLKTIEYIKLKNKKK